MAISAVVPAAAPGDVSGSVNHSGGRAMHLAWMLCELMPGDCDVRGLYALLLVTDARRATRMRSRPTC